MRHFPFEVSNIRKPVTLGRVYLIDDFDFAKDGREYVSWISHPSFLSKESSSQWIAPRGKTQVSFKISRKPEEIQELLDMEAAGAWFVKYNPKDSIGSDYQIDFPDKTMSSQEIVEELVAEMVG